MSRNSVSGGEGLSKRLRKSCITLLAQQQTPQSASQPKAIPSSPGLARIIAPWRAQLTHRSPDAPAERLNPRHRGRKTARSHRPSGYSNTRACAPRRTGPRGTRTIGRSAQFDMGGSLAETGGLAEWADKWDHHCPCVTRSTSQRRSPVRARARQRIKRVRSCPGGRTTPRSLLSRLYAPPPAHERDARRVPRRPHPADATTGPETNAR